MLRACFDPCFRLMLRLPDGSPSGRPLRREAHLLLEEAVARALRNHAPATVETARRMVEAWMDEAALSVPWEGRTDWLRAPLQRRWGEGRRAGNWFFEAADRLAPGSPADGELAGVALRCLGLGFRGRFYNDAPALIRHHESLAARFGYAATPPAFPPEPLLSPPCGLSRLSRYAGAFAAGLAACLLLAFWAFSNHNLEREAFSGARGEVHGTVEKTS